MGIKKEKDRGKKRSFPAITLGNSDVVAIRFWKTWFS